MCSELKQPTIKCEGTIDVIYSIQVELASLRGHVFFTMQK